MKDFRIFFFKVGNGHCSFIEFSDGTNALVDVKVCDENYGLDNIISIFNKAMINRIDRLIITHPHQDHIEGLSQVVRNFKINEFIYSPINFIPQPIYDDWKIYEDMKAGRYCNRPVAVKKGWNTTVGSERIDYIAPLQTLLQNWPDDVNNNSLVLKITARGHIIIIPGDMEEAGWNYISDNDIKGVSLLLASHHGNKTGYNREKMKMMNPAYVAISAGPKTEHDADDRYRKIARNKVCATRRNRVIATINNLNAMYMEN